MWLLKDYRFYNFLAWPNLAMAMVLRTGQRNRYYSFLAWRNLAMAMVLRTRHRNRYYSFLAWRNLAMAMVLRTGQKASTASKDISGGPSSKRFQKPVAMLGETMTKRRPLLHTVLLVVFCISGTLTNTGLDGKAFVFHKLSANSYILLKPNLDQGLRQLTLCLRFFIDLTRSFSLLSAASRDHDNDRELDREVDTIVSLPWCNLVMAMVLRTGQRNKYYSFLAWRNLAMAMVLRTGQRNRYYSFLAWSNLAMAIGS